MTQEPRHLGSQDAQIAEETWLSFPGGELEGKRPKTLCPVCRARRKAPQAKTICFLCYRAELERDRALRRASALDTASDARFQFQLPFEPVQRQRLGALKTERAVARVAADGHVDRRRHAQIAARHALQQIEVALKGRDVTLAEQAARTRAVLAAVHAAELQLPESWLPFVVAR